MNLWEIQQRIDEIRKYAEEGDDEAAHSREDDLHREVLACVADGTARQEHASLVLTTRDIEFERWCA